MSEFGNIVGAIFVVVLIVAWGRRLREIVIGRLMARRRRDDAARAAGSAPRADGAVRNPPTDPTSRAAIPPSEIRIFTMDIASRNYEERHLVHRDSVKETCDTIGCEESMVFCPDLVTF